jgi:hypothetical protein
VLSASRLVAEMALLWPLRLTGKASTNLQRQPRITDVARQRVRTDRKAKLAAHLHSIGSFPRPS